MALSIWPESQQANTKHNNLSDLGVSVLSWSIKKKREIKIIYVYVNVGSMASIPPKKV